MTHLPTHELFEATIWNRMNENVRVPFPTVVNFSASWCGPCRRIDWQRIRTTFPSIPFFKCDIDENEYTPGYFGVRSIPAWILFFPDRSFSQIYVSSDTDSILEWIRTTIGNHTRK